MIVIPPNPSPELVVETARAIHKKHPKMAFYLVDTEQGIAPFSAWAKDDNRPFPSRWAMKHYFGIANEFIQILDVMGDLQAVKLAWRNPTMHIVKKYSEDEASRIFDAVRGFMQRLASKPLQE